MNLIKNNNEHDLNQNIVDETSDSQRQSQDSLLNLKNQMDNLPKILGKLSDVFANPEIRRLFGDDFSSNVNSRDDQNNESESSENKVNYTDYI